MARVVIAAALYFALVFVAAFAFGTVRTFWLEPALGEAWAVAIETPFLILVMYFVIHWVAPRTRVARTSLALLGVGLMGLLLQQIAEVALILASGETLAMHLAYLRTTPGWIYLSALVIFALLPLTMWRSRSRQTQ